MDYYQVFIAISGAGAGAAIGTSGNVIFISQNWTQRVNYIIYIESGEELHNIDVITNLLHIVGPSVDVDGVNYFGISGVGNIHNYQPAGMVSDIGIHAVGNHIAGTAGDVIVAFQ